MPEGNQGLPRDWGKTEIFSQPIEEKLPRRGVKKIFTFLVVLLVVLFLVVGGYVLLKKVRSGLPGVQSEVTLNYWGLWEPEEVMRGIILDWEKDHPKIKVEYQQHSSREYRERLQSALARDEGPDIFRFHLTWTPMLKNELEPVPASVISASQFEASFYPVVAVHLRSGTDFLGLPLMVDTLSLFYNEDLFQAAGKKPPNSWEELRQLAVDLTVRDDSGQIQVAGVALGTTGNVDHWSDILGLMMLQNGADLNNPVGSFAQDALKFYTLFNTVDRVWDATLPSSTLAFASSKVAMYFGPSWRIFDIEAANPNLNFKVIPVPQLPGQEIAWASFWVEGVAKKSEHHQEAWEFLNFLSSPATLEKLYQTQSNLRFFGELYPRVEMADKLKADPLLAPFVEQMSKAHSWYLCSDTFDNGINDKIIKNYQDAVNAVNAGQAPEKALDTAALGVAQTLSAYGLGSYTVR